MLGCSSLALPITPASHLACNSVSYFSYLSSCTSSIHLLSLISLVNEKLSPSYSCQGSVKVLCENYMVSSAHWTCQRHWTWHRSELVRANYSTAKLSTCWHESIFSCSTDLMHCPTILTWLVYIHTHCRFKTVQHHCRNVHCLGTLALESRHIATAEMSAPNAFFTE